MISDSKYEIWVSPKHKVHLAEINYLWTLCGKLIMMNHHQGRVWNKSSPLGSLLTDECNSCFSRNLKGE